MKTIIRNSYIPIARLSVASITRSIRTDPGYSEFDWVKRGRAMKSRRRTIMARAVALGAPLVVVAALATPLQASAAPTDVVINEMMYNPASGNDGDEFLELYNTGVAPVDLSGWSFSGITLTFAAGTTIAANGYLVVSQGRRPLPADLRRHARTPSTPAALQRRRDHHAQGRDRRRHRHRDLRRPRAVAGHARRQGRRRSSSSTRRADNNDPLDWAASTAPLGSTPRRRELRRRSAASGRASPHVSASPTSPRPTRP